MYIPYAYMHICMHLCVKNRSSLTKHATPAGSPSRNEWPIDQLLLDSRDSRCLRWPNLRCLKIGATYRYTSKSSVAISLQIAKI